VAHSEKDHARGCQHDDGFGSALAVDGNTLLIGDAKADSGRGVVLCFTQGRQRGWRQTGSFTAPERHADDGFGSSIVVADGRAYITPACAASVRWSSRGGMASCTSSAIPGAPGPPRRRSLQ